MGDKMETNKMEITMNNNNSNEMTLPEIIFGSIMATASIYAVWCTVSLIILAIS